MLSYLMFVNLISIDHAELTIIWSNKFLWSLKCSIDRWGVRTKYALASMKKAKGETSNMQKNRNANRRNPMQSDYLCSTAICFLVSQSGYLLLVSPTVERQDRQQMLRKLGPRWYSIWLEDYISSSLLFHQWKIRFPWNWFDDDDVAMIDRDNVIVI